MSYQIKLKAIYMLTASAGPDFPKGTFIAEEKNRNNTKPGHWFVYVGTKQTAAEEQRRGIHSINPVIPGEWPLVAYRDFWRHLAMPNQNKGAPYYDAVFNAPRVLVKGTP